MRPAKGRLQSRRHGRTGSVSILANAARQRGHVKPRCSSVNALLQSRKHIGRKRTPEHAAAARNRARDGRAGGAGIAGIAEPSVNSGHHRPAASKPSKRPCDAARPKPGQPRPPQNGQGRPAPGAHPAPANWAQVLGYAARLSSVLVKTTSM